MPWDPKAENTDIDTFRQQILKPVLEATRSRRPADQIDYVVYSSDFPWGIHLDSDLKKFEPELVKSIQAEAKKAGRKQRRRRGVVEQTAHARRLDQRPDLLVAAGHDGQSRLPENAMQFLRAAAPDGPTRAFRSSQQFAAEGELTDSGGSSTCCRSCWA